MYTDCNAMLFVKEKCITTYNVPRLLYYVRHSGHSAFRPLGIPALLTLGIRDLRHFGPYPVNWPEGFYCYQDKGVCLSQLYVLCCLRLCCRLRCPARRRRRHCQIHLLHCVCDGDFPTDVPAVLPGYEGISAILDA